jgi:hypothetical protein
MEYLHYAEYFGTTQLTRSLILCCRNSRALSIYPFPTNSVNAEQSKDSQACKVAVLMPFPILYKREDSKRNPNFIQNKLLAKALQWEAGDQEMVDVSE